MVLFSYSVHLIIAVDTLIYHLIRMVLNHFGTLNDFYGLETCISTAIEEAKEYASSRNITKDSELEVMALDWENTEVYEE